MPTATMTETQLSSQASVPLKGFYIPRQTKMYSPLSKSAPPATAATLRSLYNRAAHAFLHRDISLTTSLVETACSSIHPPLAIPDVLDELRRKWDILRITLESTVYSNPGLCPEDSQTTLKANRSKSPQDFLTSMHVRSIALFAPGQEPSAPTSATLPPPVLITLINASLRLDSPDMGRVMVEDWLARREPLASPSLDDSIKENGYQKVLDLYCLKILPKLEQWDYAEEFLIYESELSYQVRESMKTKLKAIQTQAMTSRQHQVDKPSFDGSYLESPTPSSRPYSPAPSTSSSSSSLSTTSTHTVVPSTIRGPSQPRTDSTSMTHSNQSKTSISSDSTATQRRSSIVKPTLRSRNTHSSGSSISRHFSPTRHQPPTAIQRSNLSTYALIKAYLAPYITGSSLSTILLVFVVFPALSLLIRARHKSRQATLGSAGVPSNAALTRQHLMASRTGAFNRAWAAVLQSVLDTVRMAGSGLV